MCILGLICTYIAYFLFAYLCKFLASLLLHISCIFQHKMAYLPLCIFKLISAYLHQLCHPRPISSINIQAASGEQRQCCFFRQLIPPIKVVASDHDVGQWKLPLQQAVAVLGTWSWFLHASCTSCVCGITLQPRQSTWVYSICAGALCFIPRALVGRLADKG